jgi:hypothetical protein
MLSAVGIRYRKHVTVNVPEGIYRNEELGLQIIMAGLFMIDPTGSRKKLFPKSENELYVENISAVLHYETPDKIVMKGQQLCDRWTTYGTVF